MKLLGFNNFCNLLYSKQNNLIDIHKFQLIHIQPTNTNKSFRLDKTEDKYDRKDTF
jgi:hypothetical protein